jgi:hypothetical protein
MQSYNADPDGAIIKNGEVIGARCPFENHVRTYW